MPELSIQEFYALWAEDILRAVSAKADKVGNEDKSIRRYRRNLLVLSFMRASWDALLTSYQLVRARQLHKNGVFLSMPSSKALQGINRFRVQLVHHPVEAAKKLKSQFQANRAWYYGGNRPFGRLLVFDCKADALVSSFGARALPPAPPSPEGMEGLVERLTSQPALEHPSWRPFLREYISQWKPNWQPELYTMPSGHAALGYSRAAGGHVAGVQHLVLVGYAVCKTSQVDDSRGKSLHQSLRDDGSWLELLSDSLHPNSQLRPPKEDFAMLFRKPWQELEKDLPGTASNLQYYLAKGVGYVLDRVEYLPILPIVADEKGLKTRYPTASLTAANLVQQILRRVLDHVMMQDPRFSQALGGNRDVNLAGEVGPWYSQDATAATDLHAEWLTRTVYEELARDYPVLSKYTKWFSKLFGTKKLLPGADQDDVTPFDLLRQYPRAPLLDDSKLDSPGQAALEEAGHATIILRIVDDWIDQLNALPGVLTTTGQMMGDPTSFPPLMLHTLFCAQETLKVVPYTKSERVRRHQYLRKEDVVLKGVGDDAQKPRWTAQRRRIYDEQFIKMGGRLSYDKCFHHPSKSIIAEIPHEGGVPIPAFSTSVLVAPPGGSKGQVAWNTQSAAIAGDPGRLRIKFSKFLWRSSPYYYTWRLADRLGIPISAPTAYGGVGVPIVPHRSVTDNTAWLQFLSTQTLVSLVAGIGLSIGEPSSTSFLDRSARQWLENVVMENKELSLQNIPILSQHVLSDEAMVRLSLKDAYRAAVSRVRGAEFYFRAPFLSTRHNPSVRVAVRKFQQKVRKSSRVPVRGYDRTIASVEEKTSLFFSRSGGFLPDPWAPPVTASYGMERSGEVKVRQKAPFILGIG